MVRTMQQHEELWQFKEGAQIFQQILKCTHWGINNYNKVDTAIAKYLPKEKNVIL